MGRALAFRSTEVEARVGMEAVERNAKDASGACCPGRVGMEVGKGQQAQARRMAVYSYHCGQDGQMSGKRPWANRQTTADTSRCERRVAWVMDMNHLGQKRLSLSTSVRR